MATGLAPLPSHPGSGGVAAATPVVARVAAAGDGSVSLASGGAPGQGPPRRELPPRTGPRRHGPRDRGSRPMRGRT